jgi:hypothetical protein
MDPSTLMDQARDAACGDSYAALYHGCRSSEIAAWPAAMQVSELSRLVSDFALCARGAQLRPERVLADLRIALQPVARRPQVSLVDLVQHAIRDYYDGRPEPEPQDA